jgi:hypothetical protein
MAKENAAQLNAGKGMEQGSNTEKSTRLRARVLT